MIDASKERNFLNKLDLGVNIAYMRTHSTGISTNSEYGSILGSALYLSPIVTPTVSGSIAEDMIAHYSEYDLPTDKNGNPYTVPGYVGSYGEINNPLAMLTLNPTKNWSHKFVPKFSLDLQLWENLKYHSVIVRICHFGEMTVQQPANITFLATIMLLTPVPVRTKHKTQPGK